MSYTVGVPALSGGRGEFVPAGAYGVSGGHLVGARMTPAWSAVPYEPQIEDAPAVEPEVDVCVCNTRSGDRCQQPTAHGTVACHGHLQAIAKYQRDLESA